MFQIENRQSTTYFKYGVLSMLALALLFSILSLASVRWTVFDGAQFGLFLQGNLHKKDPLMCTGDMSQVSCGYLTSAKVSSVLSLCFYGLGFIFITFVTRSVGKKLTTMMIYSPLIANTLGLCFAIITSVLYSYFSNSFLESDDGINSLLAYGTFRQFSFKYDAGFYLWNSSIVLTGISTFIYFFFLVNFYQSNRTLQKAIF